MATPQVGAEECRGFGAEGLTFVAHRNRQASLGALAVSRALPIRDHRMVGPWCFLDRFGPLTFSGGRAMNVPPHPHIGIQTVTWLLAGEALHSDSLGYQAMVRPGGVNIMTAGSGIAHAEETPDENSGRLDGVQLWIALPEQHRHDPPAFRSVAQVPTIEEQGGTVQLIAGAYAGAASPAPHYSGIIGLDVALHAGAALELPVDPGFEHALLALRGDVTFEDRPLDEQTLYYLGIRRSAILLSSQAGGRALVVGGPPFPEKILMWWNFVARTPEEIAEARADWAAGRRFGEVRGRHAPRLQAPDLVRFARANPVS